MALYLDARLNLSNPAGIPARASQSEGSLVMIAPFGVINPIIVLIAIIIAGIFFWIWYLKEMKEKEKEYKNH